jgi:O-antigen ligase
MSTNSIARETKGFAPAQPTSTSWRGRLLDATGFALLAASVGWTFLAAKVSRGDAFPTAGMLLAVAAAFLAARLVSVLSPSVVFLAIICTAAALILRSPHDVLSVAPRSGPFGYSSITGAFYLQAAIAGLMLAVTGPRWLRPAGLVAAGGFALVLLATQTRAAMVLLVLAIPTAMLSLHRARRRMIGGCAALLALAIGVTTLLGATYAREGDRSGPLDRLVDVTMSERRVAFWHDAVAMIAAEPLFGVGPERFAAMSEEAHRDPDEPWAHNDFLEQGAETGVPGLVFLAGIFAWGFVALARDGSQSATQVLGAVALAALGIHACIEYVLQRPAVPVVAAALVGAAVGGFGRSSKEEPRAASRP